MKAVESYLKHIAVLCTALALFSWNMARSQPSPDSAAAKLTLQQCVEFALNHQPEVRQATLDEEINRKDIAISLSGWLPQLNLDANLQHYLRQPVAFFPNLNDPAGPKVETTTGLINTSAGEFSASQALYSTDLVFAGKTVHDLRLHARQNTERSEIRSILDVSKSFYDVMLAKEQYGLWNEEIQRLERNQEDARHLYQSGLTDKIDYQQALISVNNAKAQKRNAEETIRGKYAILKQFMGFPPEQLLAISYDSASFVKDILADTLEQPNYDKRIEYRLMETDLHLQNAWIGYYRWLFLPSISAFYNYNLDFENNSFSPLYNTSYPNSLIGLKLTLPIFQGTSRLQKLRKAHLQYQRLQLGQEGLKNQISTEYTQALASYKSNLYALQAAKTNSAIAQEVYNTVSMQYNQGIKPYLNVIIAETDLRSAKLNYLSTLFQLLASKMDLKAALGTISVYPQ